MNVYVLERALEYCNQLVTNFGGGAMGSVAAGASPSFNRIFEFTRDANVLKKLRALILAAFDNKLARDRTQGADGHGGVAEKGGQGGDDGGLQLYEQSRGRWRGVTREKQQLGTRQRQAEQQ